MAVSEMGVSRTAPGELLGQAAREPEDVAAGADVDAGDEDAVVLGELGRQGGADGVHGAEHRRVLGRRGRLGPRRPRPARRSPSASRRPGPASRRAASTAPSSERRRRGLQRLELVVARRPPGAARPRAPASGSRRAPLLDLVGRPVALGIALVVAVPAVGGGLHDERARRRRAPCRRRRP